MSTLLNDGLSTTYVLRFPNGEPCTITKVRTACPTTERTLELDRENRYLGLKSGSASNIARNSKSLSLHHEKY
jgi:hypothetical protein